MVWLNHSLLKSKKAELIYSRNILNITNMTDKKESVELTPSTIKVGINLKVGIKERLLIESLMPELGNYFEMIVGKHILRKFELSPNEVEVIELRSDSNGVVWNTEKEEPKSIELTGTEVDFLKVQIERLSEGNQLPFAILGLCEKIMDS